MKRYIWIGCTILGLIFGASAVCAGNFDGSKSLLMSVVRVLEHTPDGACREVTPASVELPQFLKIVLPTRQLARPLPGMIHRPRPSNVRRSSTESSFCKAPRMVTTICATASVGVLQYQRQPARWC